MKTLVFLLLLSQAAPSAPSDRKILPTECRFTPTPRTRSMKSKFLRRCIVA